MPLTPQEKQEYLQLQGLDTNRYDIDDNTLEPILKSSSASVNPTGGFAGQQIVSKKQFSPLNTFGRNVEIGVLPAAGGVMAGAGASALANSWTEVIPPPFGQIAHLVATLGGGLLGAYGTGKAQEAILNQSKGGQEFLQNTAESNQQNPLSAVGGNLASSLPFMRANPTLLKDAVRGAISGNVKNPALLNVALGAGVGAGQGLYDELQDPNDFNLARFALNTAGGALLNDPRTSITSKIPGMRGMKVYERPESYSVLERGMPELPTQQPQSSPVDVVEAFSREPQQIRSKINSISDYLKGESKTHSMARYAETDPVKLEQERMASEGGTSPDVALEVERQRSIDLANKTALEKQRQAGLLKQENDQAELALANLSNEGGITREQKAEQQPIYNEEQRTAQAIQEPNRIIAGQRGVNLKVLPPETKTFKGASGQEVSGEVNPATREATITQQKPDTGFHEITHVTVNDLKPALKERLIKLASKDEKAKAWIASEQAEGRNPDVEEFLTQASGEDFVTRLINRDSNLRRDLVAWFRTNISKTAEAKDVVRYLSNRSIYGTPPNKVNLTPTGFRNQELKPGDEKLKPVKVTYRGLQEGYTAKSGKKTEPIHLYNVEEDGISELPKGTTVTESGLRSKGYRLGEISGAEEHTNGGSKEQPANQAKVAPQYEKYIPEDKYKYDVEGADKMTGILAKKYNKTLGEYDKIFEGKTVDDLTLTEARNTEDKLQDIFNKESALQEQLGKQKFPALGETIPDIAKSQPSEQKPTELTKDDSKKGFLKFFEADVDKVARVSEAHSKAFYDTLNEASGYRGKGNAAIVDLSKFDRTKANEVFAKRLEAYKNNTELNLTGEEKEINKALGYYDFIRDEQNKLGLKIDGREAGKNKNYVNQSLNDEAIDDFLNRSRTPQAKYKRNKWIDHIVEESDGKVSLEDATKYVDEFISAMGGSEDNYLSTRFGALRKAAGYGLPIEIRETDAVRALEKYSRRASIDLAFWKHIESKPEIAAPMRLNNPETGARYEVPEGMEDISTTPEIKNAMKWITGSYKNRSNPTINSFVRMITNGIVGTATGVRDLVSTGANSLPYINSFSDAKAYISGMFKFRENSRKALETGAKQPSIDKLMYNEILEAPDKWTAIFNKVATGLRKWQGREAIENISRDIVFSGGRELAKNNIIGAKAGDKNSLEFLKKFGSLVEDDVTKLEGTKLESALDQIAKNFVDRNQGTYDARGLPIWTVDSPISPFVALQKWSVEKSNVIYQDVIKPALSGDNYTPLISYTLGSILTGAAIQELNKVLTGRKPQEADIKESLAFADKPQALVSELATLMQLGSFAGIVSDGIKLTNDLVLKGKTPRNIVSFPAATSLVDLQDRVADASQAIQQGENPWNTFKLLALDLMTHNVQAARIAGNYTFNKDDVNRSDKFRDLRVFKELSGEPVAEIDSTANRYLGQDSRKFKQTGDVKEAASMMPLLLEEFSQKYKDNPEKAQQFLKSLKANNFQVVPNPENMPIEFVSYYNFLVNTQGVDKARKRILEYFRQNEVNKVKASMVP